MTASSRKRSESSLPAASTEPSGDAFRAIAEFTYDWESWIGPESEVHWVNPAVERITGYTVQECLALPDYPLPLVYEPDRPQVADVLTRAAQGESGNHFEFRVRRKDGTLRWAAISWQPISGRHGERLGYRSSVRDIHERKRMEAKLRAAVKAAEEANHAKTEFLANVSHELRTPLQSIIGYAQLLLGAELGAPFHGYARVLVEQGEQLERLVDELLDFSSLQAGMLPLRSESYSPAQLVERVMRGFVPLAEAKGLHLDWQIEATDSLLGDPHRIGQVLGNLVSNAVKFTDSGSVLVQARWQAAKGELCFVVDDTGPGLPEQDILFEPFRQGRQRAGQPRGGVGLGLAISWQLCQRMGGSLRAESRPSGGARFVAVFPGKVQQAESAIAHFEGSDFASLPSRQFAESRPLQVLVVDDVEPARDFLREALKALGYSPEAAGSADEGFRLAELTRPDLILIDIQMPDVDGWSAARGFRARLGPAPFLVALSADSLADDEVRLREVGFNGFARKPLAMRELQALLSRAHQQARPHDASSALFDEERWKELEQVTTQAGESLLARMKHRVRTSLPGLLEQVERTRQGSETAQLRRALHDLYGTLALIGASKAQRVVERYAEQVEQGVAVRNWEELSTVVTEVLQHLTAETSNGEEIESA